MINEVTLGRICRAIANELAPVEPPSDYDWHQLPLDPDFSVRLRNVFIRAGIRTWGDLLRHTEDDLLELRHCAQVSIQEIRLELAKYGLTLK